MGCVKQLLEVEGRPLISRTVDAVLESKAWPVAVVIGANSEAVQAQIAGRGVIAVKNVGWSAGMASSIRAGISTLLSADPDLDAVLITPCDLPALSAEAIVRLSERHQATGLISASRYQGRNGAPAIFGRVEFRALRELKGDEGARRLLNEDPSRVAAEDLPDLGFDIDTPADLAAWKSRRT